MEPPRAAVAFFRIAFFEHKTIEETVSPWVISEEKYVEGMTKTLMDDFSSSFMDIQRIERMQLWRYTKKMVATLISYWPVVLIFVGFLFAATTGIWAAFNRNDQLELDFFEIKMLEPEGRIKFEFFNIYLKSSAKDDKILPREQK